MTDVAAAVDATEVSATLVEAATAAAAATVDAATAAAAATVDAGAATNTELVKLSTKDNKILMVPRHVMNKSITIKNMLETLGGDEEFPVHHDFVYLKRIFDFCEQTLAVNMTEEQFAEWRTQEPNSVEKAFTDLPLRDLYNVTLALNFLDIPYALKVCCKAIAIYIKTKTPDEIKVEIGIEGDFTEEEIAMVKSEHEWLKDVYLPKKQD